MNNETNIAITPNQIAIDTPNNCGNSTIPTGAMYIPNDTINIKAQTTFSFVLIGKFAFSNSEYLMKKYFIAVALIGPRASMTFWGIEKCCINDVPPHRGTCTKNKCLESGIGLAGLVVLINHGILVVV